MRKAFARLAPLADYVTVNVSSPNTPGLRGLQNRDELTRLAGRSWWTQAGALHAQAEAAILLKIAPDLDGHALDEIAEAVRGIAASKA